MQHHGNYLRPGAKTPRKKRGKEVMGEAVQSVCVFIYSCHERRDKNMSLMNRIFTGIFLLGMAGALGACGLGECWCYDSDCSDCGLPSTSVRPVPCNDEFEAECTARTASNGTTCQWLDVDDCSPW